MDELKEFKKHILTAFVASMFLFLVAMISLEFAVALIGGWAFVIIFNKEK